MKLGGNAKLYTGGTNARATWPTSGAATGLNIVNRVGDLKIPLDKEQLDATTRDTPGWEAYFAALIASGVEFQLKYDPTDTSYQTLEANFFSSNPGTLAFAILDGDKATVGTTGLWADMQVFKFEKSEPVKGLQAMDVKIAPALASGTAALSPQWIRVGTGVIST